MKATNETRQANYLAANNMAKELILSAPSVSAVLPNYGTVPMAVIIVQSYTTKKTITEVLPNVYSAVKKVKKDEQGNPILKTVPKIGKVAKIDDKGNELKDDKGNVIMEERPMLDKKGNEMFDVLPVYEDETKLRPVRSIVGVENLHTLNIVPLRFTAKSDSLNDILGAAFDDLQRAITSGRPVKVERFVNGEKKEIIINVKTAFRSDFCQIFVRVGNDIFSTSQVFGGVKGNLLKSDFHKFCSDAYKQLKDAKEQANDTVREIDTRILTALGMTKAK